MDSIQLEKLKYPIGKFELPELYSNEIREIWRTTISEFPAQIKAAVVGLSAAQLQTQYRPEGWTINQVVHHCADSHMNAFIRFKLALTEEKPTVKAYEEQLWAEQPDYNVDINMSLNIIEGLHFRWVALIDSMTEVDFDSKYIHPQTGKELDLNIMLALYNWHCKHHLAHIVNTFA
jgi:hypothetical protein